MTRLQALAIVGAVATTLAIGSVIVTRLSQSNGTARPAPAVTTPAAAPGLGRRIKARLFYVSEDGRRLTSIEHDVPYGEGPVDQAKAIVDAQIAAVAGPLVSAIPAGTKLRALFITDGGGAYVDLSRDVVTGHPGGTQAEYLTVYTLVQALTVNLPAVKTVQLLIEGKEVDTLAGHVDLRRPLVKNTAWIQ